MADEDEDGDFREFSSFLKAHPGGRYGQKFHPRGKGFFNRQRGRGRGFFNRQGGHSEGFRSSYGGQIGSNEGFWPTSNIEEGNNCFNNMDPQHHYNNEPQFPDDRVHGRGRGRQNPQIYSNRFRGHGRWRSNDRGRGRAGNRIHGHSYYHHGVSGYEDAVNSQCFGKDLRPHPQFSRKQDKNKFFLHSRGKMVGRGAPFRGSFQRKSSNFGNRSFAQCVNSEKITADAPSSVDLHANLHCECKGGGIDLKTCSRGALPATKIDGSAPLARKKLRKQKASALTQSLLDSKHVSQSPAPLNTEPEKEGTLFQGINEGTCLQEDDATINIDHQERELEKECTLTQVGDVTFHIDQRHQERAFISCIGGSNIKRPRSAAVRDFPVGCGSLQISAMKKIKTISKDSKAVAIDSVVANSIGEVGSLSNLEIMNEDSSNLIISDVCADLVQVDPKDSFEDCSRTYGTKGDGLAELLQSAGKSTTENASKMALSEGVTFAELVQASSEIDIKSKTTLSKESGHADLAQASLEVKSENCSKPVLSENYGLLEPVQDGPEGNFGDHTKGIEICKDHSAELVQSDLQVSNKECNAKIETAVQISCNGHAHLAFESLQTKLPPVPTSSRGIGHSIVKKKKKKPFVNQKAETQSLGQKAEKKPFVNQTVSSDGPLKKNWHHSKLDKLAAEPTDTSTELHNRGNVSKKLKLQDSSEITKTSEALIPYQGSKSGGSLKNKDSGRRLIHKGSTRVKHSQTIRSSDSLMHNDPAEGLCLEATEGTSARSLVKRTLHEFESVRKALVKSQDAVRRADLDAASLLKERGKWRNCEEKIVGEVPGVEVGDQFSFRMEMLIIGLHRQVQSGIDYIPGKKRNNGSPLATSIVASGGYEDDKDDGNTLIYSGQGGNNNKGNKKQESNQVLVRGNLAMTNSMKERTPVRVIRGISDLTSPSSKIYTYDGLYDVVNFRFECGVSGYGVYQFTLTRRAGQPQVGLSFLSNLKKKGLARPYLLLDDISRGQERLPVCVVNEVDEEPAPCNFTYISKIKHPVWYSPLLPQGCNCVGVCDEETCSCAVKNGNELPYNEKGYIIRDKKVVYECGSSCTCSSSCQNRVSQKGLRYRLEIFKTKNRGWGVRSIDSIQPGGFICEYTGELLTDAEAEQKVENDEYLFDLGNECNPSCNQSNLAKMTGSTAIVPAAEDVAYTIDAKDLGNVARFINHSCSPNLYAQNVLYDSDDLRFPHVMLFAMENIPPMRELTYDYNYSLDQVRDAHGNVKAKACYCGAQDCQGRLY